MAKKILYLIDATALCYRAFYALKDLKTSYGQPTNAVYGFLAMFRKILKAHSPAYMGVCFDVSRKTFRQEKFAEYKIQRPPMPDELSSQIPLIKQIIGAYGIALLEKEGYEADDIIAALSRQAALHRFQTVIVSSDKDMLQLVDETTTVVSPGGAEETVYTQREVRARFGVPPQGIPELIGLIGDKVDNIPGVPGIGEKTGCRLLQEYGTLERLFAGLSSVKGEKLRRSLQEYEQQVYMSRDLARLQSAIDFSVEWDLLKIGSPDTGALMRIFTQLEFRKYLLELQPADQVQQQAAGFLTDDQFGKACAQDATLFLLEQDGIDALFGRLKEEVFRFDPQGACAVRILADERIRKAGHDLKSLKVSLARRGIALNGLFFDTMIAAYVLNPGHSSYALKDLEWEYGSGAGVAQESTGRIERLYRVLSDRLREAALEKLFFDLEMPLVSVLAEMETAGISLDREFLAGLSREAGSRLEQLTRQIHAEAGCECNINSPKQLREVLFGRLGLPVVKKTKTGPSTDEEVLRALSEHHLLPRLLLEYRQLAKLKTTYIDALPVLCDEHSGRLHTSFNQTGTQTGRLSSSNPNLQNIPVKTEAGRQIRKALVSSDESHVLVACDYSQIELRILAHLCEDEELCRAFGAHKDIHKATAALIYGVEEPEVTGEMRDVAKRVNFGIVYGLTSYGLSRDLGISVVEAQSFIDAYFLRYPGVGRFVEDQIRQAEQSGFVTTILGRRRYLPGINDKNMGIRQFAQRQAVNTPVQGSAADLIKSAMLCIHGDLKRRVLRSRMILQVHDELVFDTPLEEVAEMVACARMNMEGVIQLKVPVKVDIKTGRNWLEMEMVS